MAIKFRITIEELTGIIQKLSGVGFEAGPAPTQESANEMQIELGLSLIDSVLLADGPAKARHERQ